MNALTPLTTRASFDWQDPLLLDTLLSEDERMIRDAAHAYCQDKLVVSRARKIQRFLSQPFFVAEQFTNSPGKFVELADTIRSFKGIVAGEYDHLPEAAFYMVGSIEEAVAKAEKMASEA